MTMMPERPFTRADFYLLLAAVIAGVAWAVAAWPNLIHMYRWDLLFLLDPRGFSRFIADRVMVLGAIRVALRLSAAFFVPLTVAVLVLRLQRPAPGFRPIFRQPGVMACAVASAVLLAEAATFPANLATLYPELLRLQADHRTNVVQYPRMQGPENIAGSIGCMIGEHPGLAVLGVLLACGAARIRGVGPSWIDRLGRFVAAFWVIAAIGFLVVPISLK